MPSVEYSQDMQRICALPRRRVDRARAEADTKTLTPLLTTAAGKAAGAALLPWQAYCLRELYENRGGYFGVPVGGGKTGISWLASVVLDAERPLLLIPASLVEKTYHDFALLSKHFVTPVHPPKIVAFEELTGDDKLNWLSDYKCDLYIIDEVDILSNQGASVPKRIARDVDERMVPCCLMTGTGTRQSILDFSHFLTWALKENCPLPLDQDELEAWALALDAKVGRKKPFGIGCLHELADATGVDGYAEMTEQGKARAAFQIRLCETPGVVIVDDEECNNKITINLIAAPEDPVLNAHFKTLRKKQVSPSGRDTSDPLSMMQIDGALGQGLELYQYDGKRKQLCQGFMSQVKLKLNAILKSSTTLKVSAPSAMAGAARWRQKSLEQESVSAPKQSIAKSGLDVITPLISSVFESATDCAALNDALTRSTRSASIYTPPRNSTVLQQSNTKSLSVRREDAVCFAEDSKAREDYTSITIIAQAMFGDCFAASAMSPSADSAILQRVWNALSHTCAELCQAPIEWRIARRDFAKFCRNKIESSTNRVRPLDTELAVKRAYADHPIVKTWVAAEHDYAPETAAVWLSGSVLDWVARWARENTGIIWVSHIEVGVALAQVTGLRYYGPKGKTSAGESILHADPKRSLIVSVHANRRGQNLQAWHKNLVLGWPQSARYVEQMLGRTHRRLQEHDVIVDVLLTSGMTLYSFDKTLQEAAFVRATQAQTQKILRSITTIRRCGFPSTELRWSGKRAT